MSDQGRATAVARLRHMMDAVEAISRYAARGRNAFDTDSAIRDAVLYQVVVLGEAAKGALAADPTLETGLPDVEWSPIARMRDRVAHHYWATDRELVWQTATVAVAELRTALSAALERLIEWPLDAAVIACRRQAAYSGPEERSRSLAPRAGVNWPGEASRVFHFAFTTGW